MCVALFFERCAMCLWGSSKNNLSSSIIFCWKLKKIKVKKETKRRKDTHTHRQFVTAIKTLASSRRLLVLLYLIFVVVRGRESSSSVKIVVTHKRRILFLLRLCYVFALSLPWSRQFCVLIEINSIFGVTKLHFKRKREDQEEKEKYCLKTIYLVLNIFRLFAFF